MPRTSVAPSHDKSRKCSRRSGRGRPRRPNEPPSCCGHSSQGPEALALVSSPSAQTTSSPACPRRAGCLDTSRVLGAGHISRPSASQPSHPACVEPTALPEERRLPYVKALSLASFPRAWGSRKLDHVHGIVSSSHDDRVDRLQRWLKSTVERAIRDDDPVSGRNAHPS